MTGSEVAVMRREAGAQGPPRGNQIVSKTVKALLTWKLALLLFNMSKKQRKTFEAVFTKPTPKNLPWSDLESLFKGFGYMVIEGDGSKVTFEKNAVSISFHRPHPQKEAKPYQIQTRLASSLLKHEKSHDRQ
ncbi:MAG: type II toxin-antitoxin system HicA family toxin [Desulfobulbus sp.]|nr:type II toxin-antitoxin system HicA family toxin [Desulfobulbus sp.]